MSWYILHISILVKKGTPSPLHAPKVYYVYYVCLEFKYNTPLWLKKSKYLPYKHSIVGNK